MASIKATSDVFFSGLRNITLCPAAKDGTSLQDPNAANLIAASNRFGLVFVAAGTELKCTSLSAIQKEHNPEKPLPDVPNHAFTTISAGGLISGVYLSADDMLLAVCADKNGIPFCHLFDVRAFVSQAVTAGTVGPILSCMLTNTPGVHLVDFAFNPVIVAMFTVVTSNGVATNYECGLNNELIIHGSFNTGRLTCCSWSPKGKQLVVGRQDGSLVQLKPQMTEVKQIPAPSIAGLQGPFVPKAIHWAASTVFLVAFWVDGRSMLIVISMQKNQPTKYIHFGDVCLRALNGEEFSRVWLCPVPKWNLVLVTCRNSSEVGVLEHSEDRLQWAMLDLEGGRAGTPFIGKMESFPIGVAICHASTMLVERKNQAPKPPSPVLLLVNSGGGLTPFHVIYVTAPPAAEAPEQLRPEGLRNMFPPLPAVQLLPAQQQQPQPQQQQQQPQQQHQHQQLQVGAGTSQIAMSTAETPRQHPSAAVANKLKVNLLRQFDAVEETKISTLPSLPQFVSGQGEAAKRELFVAPDSSVLAAQPAGVQQPVPPTATVQATAPTSFGHANYSFNFGGSTSTSSSFPPLAQSTPKPPATTGAAATMPAPATGVVTIGSAPTAGGGLPQQAALTASAAAVAPAVAAATAAPAKTTIVSGGSSATGTAKGQISNKTTDEQLLSREALSKAFFSELAAFSNELHAFRLDSARSLKTPIGNEGELSATRKRMTELGQKMDDLRIDVKSTASTVQEAEAIYLDALACGLHARRLMAAKEARLSKMDPITEATLKQAKCLAQYLERELVVANRCLDDAFDQYDSEKNNRRRAPTIEALYRVILACDKAIGNLKDDVDALKTKVDAVKRIRNLRSRRNLDLSSLADSLLKASVVSPEKEDERVVTSRSTSRPSGLSPSKLAALKNYLGQRPPKVVAPAHLSNASESMIVSRLNTIIEQSRMEEQQQTNSAKPVPTSDKLAANIANSRSASQESNAPRESLGAFLGLRALGSHTQSTPLKPVNNASSTSSLTASTAAGSHINTQAQPNRSLHQYMPPVEPISPAEPSSDAPESLTDQTLAGLTACKPFSFDNRTTQFSSKGIFGTAPQTDSNRASSGGFSFSAKPETPVATSAPAAARPLPKTNLDFSFASTAAPSSGPKDTRPQSGRSDSKSMTTATKVNEPTFGGAFTFKPPVPSQPFPSFTATTVKSDDGSSAESNASTAKSKDAEKQSSSLSEEKHDLKVNKENRSPQVGANFSFSAATSCAGATNANGSPLNFGTTPTGAAFAFSNKLATQPDGDKVKDEPVSQPSETSKEAVTVGSTAPTSKAGSSNIFATGSVFSFGSHKPGDNVVGVKANLEPVFQPGGTTKEAATVGSTAPASKAGSSNIFATGSVFSFGSQKPADALSGDGAKLPDVSQASTAQASSTASTVSTANTNALFSSGAAFSFTLPTSDVSKSADSNAPFGNPTQTGGLFGKPAAGSIFGSSSGSSVFGASSTGTSLFGASSSGPATNFFGATKPSGDADSTAGKPLPVENASASATPTPDGPAAVASSSTTTTTTTGAVTSPAVTATATPLNLTSAQAGVSSPSACPPTSVSEPTAPTGTAATPATSAVAAVTTTAPVTSVSISAAGTTAATTPATSVPAPSTSITTPQASSASSATPSITVADTQAGSTPGSVATSPLPSTCTATTVSIFATPLKTPTEASGTTQSFGGAPAFAATVSAGPPATTSAFNASAVKSGAFGAPAFGATPTIGSSTTPGSPSTFGSSPAISGFGPAPTTALGFGASVPAFGTPAAGQQQQPSTQQTTLTFGGASQQSSGPTFGSSSMFGQGVSTSASPFVTPAQTQPQQQMGSGLFAATSSTFGQPAQPAAGGGLFGKPSGQSGGSLFGQKSSFGAPAESTSLFGGGGGGCSSGSFMSGLGQQGTASPTKNVFGGGATFGQNLQQTSSLFGAGGATTFGSPSANAFGSAPTAGATSSSGFATFGATGPTRSQVTFGAAPSFGGSPGGAGFGVTPAFGAAATFSSAPAFGSPAVPASSTSNVAPFGSAAAAASTPSFGALAQNQQQQQQQQQQPQAPSSPQTPAFTQYRG